MEKHTVETFAEKRNLTKQSAINELSRLKKKGYVQVSGGRGQKRIYTITKLPQKPANGFFTLVNKYSKEKLVPKYHHRVHGNYTPERAIVDGLLLGDIRSRNASMHLFLHVCDWKNLFDLAQKKGVKQEVLQLYDDARNTMRVRKIPKRYVK